MNQSEFEAKTRNWRQARENACERGTIGFDFACLESGANFANQSQIVVKQNQSKRVKYFRYSIEDYSKSRVPKLYCSVRFNSYPVKTEVPVVYNSGWNHNNIIPVTLITIILTGVITQPRL